MLSTLLIFCWALGGGDDGVGVEDVEGVGADDWRGVDAEDWRGVDAEDWRGVGADVVGGTGVGGDVGSAGAVNELL